MFSPKVVFMGTPKSALPVLAAIEELGWPIVGVYTAPDSVSGRGKKVRPTAIKEYAEGRGLTVRDPRKPTTEEEIKQLQALSPDLVVLAAYGKILPKEVLTIPRYGSINIHPSLLPRHRGAAPVAAAILEGDRATGTSMLLMDEGIDTGPIIAVEERQLLGIERAPALTTELFQLGARLLLEHAPQYIAGELKPVAQSEEGATFVRRLTKSAGILEWAKPAENLERQIRAYDPWPGSATEWKGLRLEILEAGVLRLDSPMGAKIGTVVRFSQEGRNGIGIVTGGGLLSLTQLKLEGRGPTSVEAFVRGHSNFIGAVLPSRENG
jgi:methionyl-tRNA formyltransferase